MKRKYIKIIILIALIFIIILAFEKSNFALSNPDAYNPNPSLTGSGAFIGKAEVILGWIQGIGILIAVLTLAIIGLKYMFSSIEAKAEYKKTMLPYVFGCFLLVGVSLIIEIIERIAKTM